MLGQWKKNMVATIIDQNRARRGQFTYTPAQLVSILSFDLYQTRALPICKIPSYTTSCFSLPAPRWKDFRQDLLFFILLETITFSYFFPPLVYRLGSIDSLRTVVSVSTRPTGLPEALDQCCGNLLFLIRFTATDSYFHSSLRLV